MGEVKEKQSAFEKESPAKKKAFLKTKIPDRDGLRRGGSSIYANTGVGHTIEGNTPNRSHGR